MIRFSVKCFHPGDEDGIGEAFEMEPNLMLEFGSITFQCLDCGHEVIIKIEDESND